VYMRAAMAQVRLSGARGEVVELAEAMVGLLPLRGSCSRANGKAKAAWLSIRERRGEQAHAKRFYCDCRGPCSVAVPR
jgi:hypothetical protein